jgi:hypothetical protein
MAMKKSIGRTLAHIDVAANTSVRIHEGFFNTHPVLDRYLESAPCLETNRFTFESPVTAQFHDASVKPPVVRVSMRRRIVGVILSGRASD